ncbi:MAG: LD-carboxypeptidase [Alphaproteobacteria bacterium]|nr:LD-carboxypeptidase [Alphaproteobacteria bacterium]
MPLSFPPPLKPKGTIGLVSPARWPKPEWIAKSKALLEKRGYQVVVHAQNYLKDGQLAGSDAARTEALMDMFDDSTIDAIMCVRGGTGAIRILDRLDYKLIKKNPKPFVGFSDITVLLQAISKRCGFATYHGPLGWNLAHTHDPRTLDDMLAVIGNKKKSIKTHFSEAECIRPGRAEGILTGGNIALLQHLIGTPYDWTGKDSILFIEDVDEPIYKIDRMLQHMRLAGKFNGIRAILVGEMVDIGDGETCYARKGETPYGRSLKQVLTEALPPDVPLCFNFPCGHGKYLTTLPVGAHVKFALAARGAELSFTQA